VTLLSDWNGDLLDRLDAGRTWRGLEGVPARAAFLLAQDGTVRGSWRYADSEVPDFDELLEAARAS
jgi:peroxiredoxin